MGQVNRPASGLVYGLKVSPKEGTKVGPIGRPAAGRVEGLVATFVKELVAGLVAGAVEGPPARLLSRSLVDELKPPRELPAGGSLVREPLPRRVAVTGI